MAESAPSRRFTAAVVQAAPVSFDAEATLSKAVDLGTRVRSQGADLILLRKTRPIQSPGHEHSVLRTTFSSPCREAAISDRPNQPGRTIKSARLRVALINSAFASSELRTKRSASMLDFPYRTCRSTRRLIRVASSISR